MGDFNKKFIIREAENILEEFDKKDKEEKRKIVELKKNFSKIKKVNIALKIIISIMAICIIMLVI